MSTLRRSGVLTPKPRVKTRILSTRARTTSPTVREANARVFTSGQVGASRNRAVDRCVGPNRHNERRSIVPYSGAMAEGQSRSELLELAST
jgi:hypothetical protein